VIVVAQIRKIRPGCGSDGAVEKRAEELVKVRVIPMTQRLQKALAAFRHLRGDRVPYADGGSSVTAKVLQKWMAPGSATGKSAGDGCDPHFAAHVL
jgi:hypothetical protein